MPLIKREFGLSVDQVANINIAAVAVTILVRLVIGPMCDRYGPRKVYSGLLLVGALPVLGAASRRATSFLWCRLAIGAIGASFVITQYHTSVMFAPNVVGTANATSAGWGNAGAGAAQALIPLLVAAAIAIGVGEASAWRVALVVPGIADAGHGVVLLAPYAGLPRKAISRTCARAASKSTAAKKGGWASFRAACANYRVWMLFVTYAAGASASKCSSTTSRRPAYVDHFQLA